ncbi:hypothetical protein GB937_000073 [Aspergillus fischeri]|nr:hypothetical protein GB937_000073 [Aspergillus fischeri]
MTGSHPKIALHVDGRRISKSGALIQVMSNFSTVRSDGERPDEGPKTEVTTLTYLASNPNADIPAPKVLQDWVDANGRYFVLLERMHRQTLEQAWPSLSEC